MKHLKIVKRDGTLEITVNSKTYSEEKILKKLKRMLGEGEFFVDIYPVANPHSLEQIKKKYFAMVTELGNYLGYLSNEDRELFKEQVKVQLGNDSIASMTEMIQVEAKIEEFIWLAATHYDYIFEPNL